MKKLIITLFASLLATSLCAAPEVTFSGSATAVLGFQSIDEDGETKNAIATPAQDADSGAILTADIVSGKLSATIGIEANAEGVAPDSGAFTYDFGPAQVTYDAVMLDQRWNTDGAYTGNALGNALSVTAMDYAFVTLMSPLNDHDGDLENYVSEDKREVPAVALGLDHTFGPTSLVLGAAFDMGKITSTETNSDTGEEVESTDDYSGMMVYLDSTTELNSLAITFAAMYGVANGALIDDEELTSDDTSMYSLYLNGAYSLGALTPAIDLSYAVKSFDTDEQEGDFTYLWVEPYVEYAIDDNFTFTVGYTYESESAVADDDGTDPTITHTVFTKLGYSF